MILKPGPINYRFGSHHVVARAHYIFDILRLFIMVPVYYYRLLFLSRSLLVQFSFVKTLIPLSRLRPRKRSGGDRWGRGRSVVSRPWWRRIGEWSSIFSLNPLVLSIALSCSFRAPWDQTHAFLGFREILLFVLVSNISRPRVDVSCWSLRILPWRIWMSFFFLYMISCGAWIDHVDRLCWIYIFLTICLITDLVVETTKEYLTGYDKRLRIG